MKQNNLSSLPRILTDWIDANQNISFYVFVCIFWSCVAIEWQKKKIWPISIQNRISLRWFHNNSFLNRATFDMIPCRYTYFDFFLYSSLLLLLLSLHFISFLSLCGFMFSIQFHFVCFCCCCSCVCLWTSGDKIFAAAGGGSSFWLWMWQPLNKTEIPMSIHS